MTIKKPLVWLSLLLVGLLLEQHTAVAQSRPNGKYAGITGVHSVRMTVRGRSVRKFSGYFPLVCTDQEEGISSRVFAVSALDNISFPTDARGNFDYTFEYEDTGFRQGLVQVTGKIRGNTGRVVVSISTASIDGSESCEDAQSFRLRLVP